MNKFSKCAGLDTHKEMIAVAVADVSGGKPRYYGEIVNTPDGIRKLVKKLCPNGFAAANISLINNANFFKSHNFDEFGSAKE